MNILLRPAFICPECKSEMNCLYRSVDGPYAYVWCERGVQAWNQEKPEACRLYMQKFKIRMLEVEAERV